MKIKYTGIVLIMQIGFLGPVAAQKQNLSEGDHLTGTKRLTLTDPGELRSQMIGGMFRYFEQELESASLNREQHWNRDYFSNEEYLKSIASNRDRFKKITGIIDERKPFDGLMLMESTAQKALVAQTDNYSVYYVKWPVFEGVTGTGLWVEPHENVQSQIVGFDP